MAKDGGKKTRAQKVNTKEFVTRYLEGRKEGQSYGSIAKSMWPGLDEARAVRSMRHRIQQTNKQLSDGGYTVRLEVPPAQKVQALDIASIATLIEQHQGA